MNPDGPLPDEDRFTELFAAHDEALGHGPGETLVPGTVPPELQPRLERDLACARLLRTALGRPDLGSPDLASALPWQSLGRFRLVRELGRGGFGVVYLAHDPLLNRPVALKVPRAEGAVTPELRQRFQREARAAAGLEHPHIVPVYEAGEVGPVCFLVSAYCPGPTLARWLRERREPVPAREAAALLATLADAVQHAHGRGVIHRDLKPDNILLRSETTKHTNNTTEDTNQAEEQKSPDPDQISPASSAVDSCDSWFPLISDFGLAKVLLEEAGPAETRSGAMLGTPSYMAPEQASGRSREVGPAADVYGLGAILYEVLTGRPPFVGETNLETLLQVRSDEPVPPSRLRPRLPRDLETICLTCLHKEPARRYASAGALAEDLRRFLQGVPIRARPAGRGEKLWRWCRRNPVVAGLTAAVALSLVAGTVVSWSFAAEARDRASEAEDQAREVLKAKGIAENRAVQLGEANRLSDERLYISELRLAQRAWHDYQIDWLRDLLDGQRPRRAGDTDLRHFEWYYWDRLGRLERLSLAGHSALAFSPDSKYLATAGDDRKVLVRDAISGRELHTFTGHAGSVTTLACSPDGKRLASASAAHAQGEYLDRTIRVWDLAGDQSRTLEGHTSGVSSIAFSRNGKYLASASHDQTVKIWDAAAGTVLHTLQGDVAGVAFHPDSRRLALAHRSGTVKLWDLVRREELRIFRGHTAEAASLAFSPDGRWLVSGSSDQTVRFWDLTGALASLPRKGHTGEVTGLAFSPDGKYLVSASKDRTVRVWEAISRETILTLGGHTGEVTGVAFSPDGKYLASAAHYGSSPGVTVWDVARLPVLVFRGRDRGSGHVTSVAFSPDGTRLAAGSTTPSMSVKVWDTTLGTELHTLKGHPWGIGSVAFSPDGTRLATASGGSAARPRDGMLKVWDVASGKHLFDLDGHMASVTSVAFSPDGTRLVSGSADQTVKVWDLARRKEVVTLKGHTDQVISVAFHRDGRRLASASQDGKALVWDMTRGEPLLTLKGHGGVYSVAFSPDGRLASAGYDKTVRLWDPDSGRELRLLRGHSYGVRQVAFSADGRRLASVGSDRHVRVWDTAHGQELLSIQDPEHGFTCVSFSTDGHRLAAGWQNTVKVWDATPPAPEAAPGAGR